MKKVTSWLVMGLMVALLAGCASTPETTEAPVQEGGSAQSQGQVQGQKMESQGAQAQGTGTQGELKGSDLQNPQSPLSQRVFYFDFDSSEIRSEYADVLAAHGQYLASHPDQKVVVEGHTDQRGSREYNLALGERRANAVKRVLVLNGASEDQISVVSYGEEKPAAFGDSEEAMQKNRRAELVYVAQ